MGRKVKRAEPEAGLAYMSVVWISDRIRTSTAEITLSRQIRIGQDCVELALGVAWRDRLRHETDANANPTIRGTDDAVWERLKPIPFTARVPAERIDRDLPRKLRAEAEGILAWAVEGCRRWMREGIGACGLGMTVLRFPVMDVFSYSPSPRTSTAT